MRFRSSECVESSFALLPIFDAVFAPLEANIITGEANCKDRVAVVGEKYGLAVQMSALACDFSGAFMSVRG